ncbi:phage antirepressor KilAC domain-containing protein [Chryseobacterium sp.]|uniref:phage antirepressor KilAC domain-containing protein n=1 Tax=Chryseobacterium sp. TaxID=1871047 RepID=UPI0024E1ABE9|nr:phage antirepressor KilAC domain-containing protein [Chryseobacterium sp.]
MANLTNFADNSNELIKISEENGKQAVSARELHFFLGSKKDFSSWIKDRIEKYGFVENHDYEVFTKSGENSNGGRPLIEYALSIDCAKEISMVEGNERGKLARRYFIECEKKLKSILPTIDFSNPDTILLLAQNWKEEQTKRMEAEKKIEENKPKVMFTDAVIGSSSSCLIGELAKIISQNGIEIGQNRLFIWLREKGYLGKVGERKNIPNQQYVEQGLFELKKGVRSGSDGVLHTTITTKVTGNGQVYFVNKFLSQRLSA